MGVERVPVESQVRRGSAGRQAVPRAARQGRLARERRGPSGLEADLLERPAVARLVGWMMAYSAEWLRRARANGLRLPMPIRGPWRPGSMKGRSERRRRVLFGAPKKAVPPRMALVVPNAGDRSRTM